MGDGFELELDDGLFHNGFVFVCGAALVVGVAAEHEQVAHGDAAVDAVFLREDGGFGFGGGGGSQVAAVVGNTAGLGGLQPRHQRRQGGFTAPFAPMRAVMPFGDVERNVVEYRGGR